nr:MAG TPA: hypothetical protein [Caudoviricetes sp.]
MIVGCVIFCYLRTKEFTLQIKKRLLITSSRFINYPV